MYKLVNDVILNLDNAKEHFTIDIDVSYDAGLANIYMDDFKSEYVTDVLFCGRYNNDAVYICGDSSKKAFKPSKLSRLNKVELWELYKYFYSFCDINDMLKMDYLVSLENLDLDDLLKACVNESNLNTLADEIGIFTGLLTVSIDYHQVNGYSQGDVSVIIDLAGNNFKADDLQNTLFDTPLYARLTICDSENLEVFMFNLCDHLKSEYEVFDKDDFLKHLKADLGTTDLCDSMKDIIIGYAEINVPTTPNY